MSTYKFNPKHLYENTNAGLDIIFKYCPQAVGCERTNKLFKLREDEDTASASLLLKEDCWIVKDFGDKGYNPIELCRYFTGFSFIEALKHLYSEFNLSDEKTIFVSDTTFKTNPEHDLGWFEVIEAKDFNHIDLVGRFLTEKIALEYDFIPVAEYSFVFTNKKTNEKTLCTTKATENYPIFAYKFCDTWAKIYQPLDKKYKHSFVGKKPERHVYGLTRLRAKFQERMDIFKIDIANAISKKDDKLVDKLLDEQLNFKLDSVIICSGGSDGLGVASLGYNVIWFNSESEQLNWEEYNELKTLCKEIYNLPDIDAPGTKYGYQVAEQFWNLKTIWLPESIKQNNGKDYRDWLKKYSKSSLKDVQFQFKALLTGALQMKFFARTGANKTLKINTAYLHYFLKVKGFYVYYPDKIYLDRTSEQEFIFIRIENNVVYQEFANTIKKFCEKYMINKGQPIEVINLIKNTTQFTDKNLLGLDSIVLNIKNFTADSQKFYFKNQFATVTANEIKLQPYSKLDTHIWNNKLINYNVLEEKPFFSYAADENGLMKLQLLRNDCEFMNFLINTSRMNWKREFEHFENDEAGLKAYKQENKFRLTSEYLSEEENQEHTAHFLSKMFGLGYMMHRYKVDSFARLLYVMDNNEIDSEEERNGGTGKTLQLKGLDPLMQRFRIDGSQENLFKNPFILGSLNKEFDYILIDDYSRHYNIDPVYVWVTDGATINPKFKSSFDLKFEDFPKIAITRNFGLKRTDGSDNRRIIYISNSDFYHSKTKEYPKEHRVSFDFGHDLFKWDKDSKQPSIHFGFLMQCLQLYLQFRDNELLAPQKNIDLNNSLTGIGDSFKNWADAYFVEDFFDSDTNETIAGNLNNHVRREDMMASYVKSAGKMAKNATNFKKSLKEYCALVLRDSTGKIIKDYWEFNPSDVQGYNKKNKNIYKRVGNNADEHFFIRTIKQDVATQPETEEIKQPDLPF